jgi:hypothetical protein
MKSTLTRRKTSVRKSLHSVKWGGGGLQSRVWSSISLELVSKTMLSPRKWWEQDSFEMIAKPIPPKIWWMQSILFRGNIKLVHNNNVSEHKPLNNFPHVCKYALRKYFRLAAAAGSRLTPSSDPWVFSFIICYRDTSNQITSQVQLLTLRLRYRLLADFNLISRYQQSPRFHAAETASNPTTLDL